MLIEAAAAIFLITAITFAALWWRQRVRLRVAELRRHTAEREHSRLESMLAFAPAVGFSWSRGGAAETVFGRTRDGTEAADFARFRDQFEAADAQRIAAAVEGLRRGGVGFTAMVSTPAGDAYQLEGSATGSGDAVMWVADVTASRRAETANIAVRGEAAVRRAMLDALPIPVWRRDAALRVVDRNAAYAALTGLSSNEASAEPPDPTATLAKAAADGVVQRERRHVVIDGSRRCLELVEAPGRAGGTIGWAIDQTELETARNELLRHVNAHGQVLERIHAAVAIFGPTKRLGFFNTAFAKLWGLEAEWLAGEPSLDELLERLRERRRAPEYADFRAFKRQQLAMFTSLIEPQTELMHLPDGRTLRVSVSPHPLGGLVYVYEDVTDRLALERSYNTLIEVQRETLDNLFEGIAVFGSDGRLKLHNPAYQQMWGLSDIDLTGQPRFGDIMDKTRGYFDDDSNWAAARRQITATITAHVPWSGQVDRRDGTILRLSTVPLPDGNALLTGLDVTDSATVERALRESNDALETAGRLKSEFIANVSYELRTPLNAVIGFAEILTNQYFGTLTPRQLEYSQGILASSNRLMSLINDILDLATIEAGYMVLDNGRVDICGLLDSVMGLTGERARAQGLTLTMSCPADIGAIEGDERRLKQALFNLVSNAMKFTPAGKSIALEARLEGEDIVLAVADTGIGISAADQQRVFEKFERGKPNSRDAGAGLGLSLVKSLIELHGGSVDIDSEPGRGTTILCRLPARRVSPARKENC
jgi:signal transduction histidine kinase